MSYTTAPPVVDIIYLDSFDHQEKAPLVISPYSGEISKAPRVIWPNYRVYKNSTVPQIYISLKDLEQAREVK